MNRSMQQKGCIHIAHPQFISSNKSKTIQSIINTVKIYEGKSGVWRTAFHTVRKLKEIHPDITDIEIKPYIEVYFANKGLDYELYLIKIVEILDEDIDTNAPFYDVLERLQAGELDELPAGMLHTSDLSILATACRMLSEMDASGIFYLSSRKAGILIDKSHTHAAACLKKLQRQGLICLVKEYEKHQRKASEYRYGKHSETINFTQVTQVTQITQPTQGYTVKNPGISEKHRDDTIDLVGGDSTQFINHPSPKSGNLGTPEESIELSVDKLKDGVLGTLPKQELIPRIKSEQNSPLTDFPAVKEEGEVKCVICQKPTLYKNSSGSYVHPDDLVVRCPACKAKATQNIKPKKDTTSGRAKHMPE